MTRRFYAFPNFATFFSLVSAPRSALSCLHEEACRHARSPHSLPAYIDALKNFLRCGDEEERASLLEDDFRNLLNTIGFHAEWHPDTVRKNREVIEAFLRFYESEAPEKHSASVTMAKIRAVWEEA